ncbi:phenylalanine--tRNA ligase subunit beta [Catenovulum sp. 2E275]|uniref:phenylalanine--tRNA ligase subunit beta n=1 Tax=Catenovulum sp. 2E275 TaxID=2980497 RepID=UPI0021D19F89|nr:phenylalanine--tRNA ligase subunit beta [Catenovulum sp. 2E275]MCU4674463.1 phenylalanine--tRNA ligase subunit beta [Catenovulum sp. 2E275]
MKFSESWLREWVNPQVSSETLIEQITMAGLEVDSVEPVAGEFSGVVVGKVVECGPHPDAEKLQVTKIDVGAEELLDIVCGAKNCRLGLTVAVATIGAVLPGNFKIKKAKLRGVPSFGMLCSEAELGMADEAPGIMELPQDAVIGTDVREYLKLNDKIIEVDLTPNRSDCLGIKGLAREVGVLNNLDVNEPNIEEVAASIATKVAVNLNAGSACTRYLGRVVEGVDVRVPSPLWLVEKLRRSGIRSVDAIVDVTNYVMLELGQPMHAFDLAKIDGGIQVRFAKQDEALTLLDGNEVKLKDNTLVIADDNKALAMAGIFGGEQSGVAESTQNILLESAFFAPDAIMGKARQYGLHTDSSHRFERGVDTQIQRQAIERATALILEICGGQAGEVVCAQAQADEPAQVSLRASALSRRLGIEIAQTQVTEILTRLGLQPQLNGETWHCIVPSYRFDISIEEDLIEEVARVFGYNNIANIAPQAQLTMRKHDESKFSLNKVRNSLITLGYQEAITYSFVDPKAQQALYPNQESLILPNPISADMSAMRLGLLPGLLSAVAYNQNRQQARVRLFESGLKFIPDQNAENGIRQVPVLGAVISGLRSGEHWNLETAVVDFYDIKGDLEALLRLTGEFEQYEFKAQEHSALHPGQSAAIYKNGEQVGFVGAIHPQALKPVGLKQKAFVFEIELSALLSANIPSAKPVSKFPSIRRDLAFIVKQDVEIGKILTEIKKVGSNQLVELNLFDVYQGSGISSDEKSFAVSLVLQDVEKTLEDSEISVITDTVINTLNAQFGATLRD